MILTKNIHKVKEKISRRVKNLWEKIKISGKIKERLTQNYHVLSWPERLAYWLYYRGRMNKDDRFFFEGERGLQGQMYIRDRKGLYDTILEFKPRHCLEVGTWTGGGSTFFLGKAFEEIGKGKLYTLESDQELYDQAISYYTKNLPQTRAFVEFIRGDNVEIFRGMLESAGSLDCCFLDGSDNSAETIRQYDFLKKYFRSGTILMAHDWNTAKMIKLRPIILADKRWKFLKKIEEPESVGFVVLKYI
ncbi:hypothetical protein BK006_01685 [bacterium CG10_49_38]|nr:MAG: hypothetical protein BK006_01685 [bacterium CG10_49_38]